MATQLTQSIVAADPTIQAIARAQGGTGRSDLQNQIQSKQRMKDYLQSKGYELPTGFGFDQSGKLIELPHGMNWWALAAPASVLGGVGIASALGAGGGAAAAGTSAAAPAAAGGAGAAGAGAGGAAVAGTSIWSKIAAPLIGIGSDIVQGVIGSKAAKGAAETQAAAGAKSLALQKQIYDQGQANLSPYMSAGAGAITNLRGLTGQSLTPAAPSPMTAPGQFPGGHPGLFPGSTEYAPGEGPANLGMPLAAGPPAAISAPSLNSLASQQTGSGYVTMRSPDGKQTKAVPASEVQHWLDMKATVVS